MTGRIAEPPINPPSVGSPIFANSKPPNISPAVRNKETTVDDKIFHLETDETVLISFSLMPCSFSASATIRSAEPGSISSYSLRN